MLRISIGFVLYVTQCLAISVPAGTEIQIRLREKVSTESTQINQPVVAVVIAPVLEGTQVAIPAGTEIRGIVKSATPANAQEKISAALLLNFDRLMVAGSTVHVNTLLIRIDNARESLNDDGTIQGMVPGEMLTARIDQGLGKLEHRFGGLADILEAAKGALVKDSDPQISYEPGVEMTLKLVKAIDVKPSPPVNLIPFPDNAALSQLVNYQPFQTYAVKPPIKSDITNLMFIGTREELAAAFAAAGWSNAAALNDRSKFKTAKALIEQRGYNEAPVSVLILDDRPPDIVYEKGNNTFAARHHLRVWRGPNNFMGQPVWISSSTHDTGIDFSQQSFTFIHKIDPDIDAERAKVVNDLMFAGKVKSLALVSRPRVPKHSQNATGDNLNTDGAMAVMLLQ